MFVERSSSASVGRVGLSKMSSLFCLLSVFVVVTVAYPSRSDQGEGHLKSLYYNRVDGIPERQYESADDNLLLYLLSKNAKGKTAPKYFHYTAKKSLDKLGGGNLVKRNLVNPSDFDALESALFNNELPCIFEYYVNGNNEVVMVCKHDKLHED